MQRTEGWHRLSVTLVNWSNNASETVANAAGNCYSAANPHSALEHAMAGGHESVLEHASYTFRIGGVSRACLAQLTRHRLASYSVQSQRYVNQEETAVVRPPKFTANAEAMRIFEDAVKAAKEAYAALIELGMAKEDARYILPEGTETILIVTMNARELRHFFSLRCCNRAQWEIRSVADRMLAQVKAVSPELFADAGPGCVRGKCPESKPCGHSRKYEP